MDSSLTVETLTHR